MNTRTAIVRRAAAAPLRTIRTSDLAGEYAHPRQEVREFERQGLLHRLAHGIYCAVPPEAAPETWRPSLEGATAAIATAHFGDRVPVLTGLTAARVHQALPRAISTGYVAVPTQRRPLRFADREGEVRFVMRDVTALDAVLVQTDLGPTLASTPEQTVLDLARNDPRAESIDAQEAIAALWPECDHTVLEEIAQRQRMRTTLARVTASR